MNKTILYETIKNAVKKALEQMRLEDIKKLSWFSSSNKNKTK